MGSLWVPSPSAMNELANGWPSTVPRTLTRPRVPKKAAESGMITYVQPPLLSFFCSFAVNCRFRGSFRSLIEIPFGGFSICTPMTTRQRPKRHRGPESTLLSRRSPTVGSATTPSCTASSCRAIDPPPRTTSSPERQHLSGCGQIGALTYCAPYETGPPKHAITPCSRADFPDGQRHRSPRCALMDATDAFALADLDAIAQAGLAASGELSATELLEAAIVRLEAARTLNAVVADLF